MNKCVRSILLVAPLALLGGCSATPSQVVEGVASFALVEGARHAYIKGCENTWTTDLECSARYDTIRDAGIQRHAELASGSAVDEQARLASRLVEYLDVHAQ